MGNLYDRDVLRCLWDVYTDGLAVVWKAGTVEQDGEHERGRAMGALITVLFVMLVCLLIIVAIARWIFRINEIVALLTRIARSVERQGNGKAEVD